MNEQLSKYIADYEKARTDVRELVGGLDENLFNHRPDPDSWSVAECVDHLCVLGNQLLPRLDAGIKLARTKNWTGEGPFRYGFFSNLFIRMVAPPSGNSTKRRKYAAPRIYRPSNRAHSANVLVRTFDTLQDKLIERATAADGLDIARVRVASPVSVLMRIRLGAWFEAIAAHQFRHIEQARRARDAVIRRSQIRV